MTERQPLWQRLRQARLFGVLGVYAASGFAVLQAFDILSNQLGLPGWVFIAALILLILGLPIVLATAWLQSRHAAPRSPDPAPTTEPPPRSKPTPRRHWLTWRRAITGGVFAFAGLGIITAAWAGSRALGIGPAASLVSAGVLDPSDRLLVADFGSTDGDATLADVVTEALRVDLSQSSLFGVVDAATVQDALVRMERDPGAALDAELAREVAQREGIGAVVAGEIGRAGPAHVIAVRLIAAEDGRELEALRETARDSTEVIDAVDRLSRKLRERIGESLRTIRANDPLERVTTASLPALRRYTQAVRALDVEDEFERGVALLEEALREDTAFAMAWRKLAVALGNRDEDRTRALEALARAYAHRDRLTARERWLTESSYHRGNGNESGERAALEALLVEYPDDYRALNNLALVHIRARDYAGAEDLLRRSIDARVMALTYRNLAEVQTLQGKFDEAEATVLEMAQRTPESTNIPWTLADLAADRLDHETADSIFRALYAGSQANPRDRAGALWNMAAIAAVRGRIAESERLFDEAIDVNRRIGRRSRILEYALTPILVRARVLNDPAAAGRRLDQALKEQPLEELPPLDRPYLDMAFAAGVSHRPAQARRLVAEYEQAVPPDLRNETYTGEVLAMLHLVEGRPAEAAAAARLQTSPCALCGIAELARAHDAAGAADSAIAAWRRYVDTPATDRLGFDVSELAIAYERLGQLHDERGDRTEAARFYAKLVELWGDADPVLRPRVEAARRRLAEITADRG